jgi:hypothetical protein
MNINERTVSGTRNPTSISRLIIAACFIATCQGWASDVVPTTRLAIPLPLKDCTVSKDDKGVARFTTASFTGAVGQPALPVLTLKALLPPNADMRTVQANLTNETSAEVDGEFDVEPAPPAVSRGETLWPKGTKFTEGRDDAAYSTAAYAPASFLGLLLPSQMREWRMAEVQVRPFKYNPVTKRLLRLGTGTLVITFERIQGLTPTRTHSPTVAARFREDVRSQVVNFDDMVREYEPAGK